MKIISFRNVFGSVAFGFVAFGFCCAGLLAGLLCRGAAALGHCLSPKGNAPTVVWEHVAKNPAVSSSAVVFSSW